MRVCVLIVITICFSMSQKKAKSPTTWSRLRQCSLSPSLSASLCLPLPVSHFSWLPADFMCLCVYFKRFCVQMSWHSPTLQNFLPLLLCLFYFIYINAPLLPLLLPLRLSMLLPTSSSHPQVHFHKFIIYKSHSSATLWTSVFTVYFESMCVSQAFTHTHSKEAPTLARKFLCAPGNQFIFCVVY